MELNWSTFVLEIVNFLILIWILSRFLYRPILNTIAQRRDAIQQQWQQVADKQQAAEELQNQYENRLADWEQEKNTARKKLHDDVEAERRRLLEEVQAGVEAEKQKQAAIAQHHIDDQLKKNQKQALRQGAAFAAKLLARLATPALQERIVEVMLEDIKALSNDSVNQLRSALRDGDAKVIVSSAFSLADDVQSQIKTAIEEVVGGPPTCRFISDPQLIGGLHISVGAWSLQASIQDELQHFAEVGNDGP